MMAILIFLSGVVCNGITFFMLCIFQWHFGPWELIIMTVFLSYSLEPALHIVRDFVGSWQFFNAAACSSGAGRQGEVAAAEGDVAAIADAPPAGLPALPSSVGDGTPHSNQAVRGDSQKADDACSEATDGEPSGSDPAAIMQRSVYRACNTVIMASVKLILCGIMLLPCEFRLFSRLGAVAILVPIFWVPTVLIMLPGLVLLSGRQRREPDFKPLYRYLLSKVSTLWT